MGPELIAAFTSAAPYFQMAGMAFGAYSSYSQSVAQKNAYEYQSKVAENNAKIAQWQAEDAVRRGQDEEANHRLKVAMMGGSQKASMAARGIDLGYGSALDILTGTDFMGEIDALRIRDNATKEAWGYGIQSSNAASDSAMLKNRADSESPIMAAGGSLLTSAGSVAESWQTRKDKTGKYWWE